MSKLTKYWVFPVQIPQKPTPSTLSKIAKLMEISHIDGKIPPYEDKKDMSEYLENYLKETLGPFISKPIFGSLVCGIGSPYLQVIEEDNDNAWCWDSINFDNYMIFSDLQDKGPLRFLAEKLKKINKASYYLFCKKYSLDVDYSGYHGDHIGLSKEALADRIRSDIDAQQDELYREGFEAEYLTKFDSRIHKEEYLYDLLDEALSDYQDSHQYIEDRQEAFESVKSDWFCEYPGDILLTEIFNELEGPIMDL